MKPVVRAMLDLSTDAVKFFPVPGGVQLMAKKSYLGVEGDNPESLKVVARYTIHSQSVTTSLNEDVIFTEPCKKLLAEVKSMLSNEGYPEYEPAK